MLRTIRALLCACFILSIPAIAQDTLTTASITGRLIDPTGAAIPGITITLRELSTSQIRTVKTDAAGHFRVPFLPAGQYVVEAAPVGFARIHRPLQVTIGAAFDMTIEATVDGTSTSVEVTAQAPLLEANRSQISETIQQGELTSLPYNGRNFLDAALLAPGVAPTNTNSVQTFAETAPIIGQGLSVNAQRNFSNSFVVDGLSANDDAAGLAGNSYGLDVVREFQVVTSGGQAEFGRALGGYFNIVTRSGSNDVHGTAYAFLRNQRLNANNALSRSKLPLTQGQFGLSLSGPLHRNRTFFFSNYEGRRLNTNGVITINPTQAAQINTRLNAIGFSGPRLTVSTGPATLYPTTVHTDNGFLRLDHHVSDADQFSLRYSYYALSSINARGVGSLADVSYGTAVRDTNHTVALSNIATITPRTFNETRAQFTYDSLNAPSNTDNSPAIVISGVATFGRFSSSPTARLNFLYEVLDNFVLQRGSHSFKMGADLLFNDDTITSPQTIRGSYTFACIYDNATAPLGYTGTLCTNSLYSGRYNNGGYTQTFGTPSVQQNNPNIGLYLQDEWKVKPSLTINAGVRYDLQFLSTIHTDKNNVSPRVGFAWSPFRNKLTVVRGSFGLFYDRIPLRALANALLSANNTTDASRGRLLSYTFSPSTPGAPSFPNTASAPPPGAVLNYALMNRNVQNAYALQASLGIEQQMFRNATLGVSYQHVRGLHLLSSYNTNINADGTRPDPTRGNVKPYDSRFDSYYDGLAISYVQRPRTWASARISYTWSKAINNVGEFFFSSPINNFDFSLDRARSDDDQRHRAVFDTTLTSPSTPAHGLAARITHGWRFGGILQYYSRLPFNITTGANTLQQTTARPCVAAFFGTAACAQAARGAIIRRNAGIGFDFFNINARVSRTFPLTQRIRLEGIAETFNALNHRNDALPNGTFGTGRIDLPSANANFSQATAVGDPRCFQIAARISF